MSDWFAAHKDGLRQIAERLVERRGFGIIAGELYQNVMDTNATTCTITLEKVPGKRQAELTVEDNDPEGFSDLTHAYTLFAPSAKKADAEKAGRFNVGEKMVLSFCREAYISTTKGTVVFDATGRTDKPRAKRPVGTQFWAVIDCTHEWYDQFIAYCKRIIVKPGLTLTVNGEVIPGRTPLRTFKEKLSTEVAGEDGVPRKSVRLCEVQVYEPMLGEEPMLFELGIPVVETGDKWSYNVLQKVPLNVDRDNVTAAYLRDLRVCVFNHMHEQVTGDETMAPWVSDATSDGKCSAEAVEDFRTKKFGDKSLAFDPSNPEANNEAVAKGYTLIPARGLTPGQRQNLYDAGTLRSSSAEFPLAGKSVYSDDPNAKPVEVIPYDEWTAGMSRIADYTQGVAKKLIGKAVKLQFVNCKSFHGKPWSACYGRGEGLGLNPGEFHYNVHSLGKGWFDEGITERQDDLILHELGHEFCSNHLDEAYYRALTKLGARLKKAVLDDPDWFRYFVKE
jgi:hypothetical protein